jgi:hypothetical protein
MKGRTTVRKIVSAFTGVTMMFAVGLAAGCGPENLSSNGPNTDGWGNHIATGPDGTEACAVPSGRPVVDAPYTGGRPKDVLPGNSWIVFELTVRAMPPDEGRDALTPVTADFCVPVNVHVYTRPGEADTAQIDQVGFESGPFDFVTTTPWTGRYVALQYNPAEERFQGRPPAYEIHLQARYDLERDMMSPEAPEALACTIRINGAPVAFDLAVMPSRQAVECVLKGNDGWHPY